MTLVAVMLGMTLSGGCSKPATRASAQPRLGGDAHAPPAWRDDECDEIRVGSRPVPDGHPQRRREPSPATHYLAGAMYPNSSDVPGPASRKPASRRFVESDRATITR